LGQKESQCCFKQRASAEAQKWAKFKLEPHKNNAINIDDFLVKFEHVDELPEIQEFMNSMNMEVREQDLSKTRVKHGTTKGLILEIAAIKNSESDVKSIIRNEVQIDTGFTRTII
jgi:hypothetical protein